MKTTIILLFMMAFCAEAQTNWYGQLLLTDGAAILPNASIPTPAEVGAVAASAASAKATAQGASAQASALLAEAAALDARAAALDGAAIVYGSCVAFGAEAVEVPTNVTATVVDFNFPSNGTSFVQLYVHYSDVMDEVWPMVSSSLTGAWTRQEPAESVFGTWTIGGESVDAYRMLIPTGDADTLFFRANGEVRQSVVGQLNVLDGLTVNGVAGLTTTNSIGIFYNGLLVEMMEGGAE